MANFDPQPTLMSQTLLVRPMQANDFEDLFAAASDPLIWEQHPSPLRYRRDVFDAEIFQPGLNSGCALTVLDKASGAIIGSSRYYDIDPAQHELAIGYTFLVRSHWGGSTNGELKRLMIEHAFGWANRVWLHVGENNRRSRKAVEKIGGKLSHMAPRLSAKAIPVMHAYYVLERQ